MASRGRGRRGRLWGDGRPPPIFYQMDFIEAMGAAIATAALLHCCTSSSDIHGRRGPDGIRPLVPLD